MSSGSNNEAKTVEGNNELATTQATEETAVSWVLIAALVVGAVAVWWFFFRGKK